MFAGLTAGMGVGALVKVLREYLEVLSAPEVTWEHKPQQQEDEEHHGLR
jgi:hypothetical protein